MDKEVKTERVGILLIPTFQMLSFFLAVETLRIANRLAAESMVLDTVIQE